MRNKSFEITQNITNHTHEIKTKITIVWCEQKCHVMKNSSGELLQM